MGYGCLGEETDLRSMYGERAAALTPDYIIFEAYNRMRSALHLTEVHPPMGNFDIGTYCNLFPIIYKEDVPIEYVLLFDHLMCTMR